MTEPIYTPISLLKKVFRSGERSLARQEITQRLQNTFNIEEYEADEVIRLAIDPSESPFREGSSRAIIEFMHGSHSLANHVYRILQEAGLPMSDEQILRKLRGNNLVSWSFPFDRLGLLGDHRFVQLKDDQRWTLSDWEWVNDEVYQYLANHGTTEVPLRDIPHLLQIKMGLPKRKCLFLPEYDHRFLVDENKLVVVQQHTNELEHSIIPVDEPSHVHQEVVRELENTSFMEVATAMSNEILEVVETKETTVVDGVLQDLTAALIKLEQRSTEMKNEVVNYFSSNNLEAIKGLMHEKEKNEKVLLKIKDIVDELS